MLSVYFSSIQIWCVVAYIIRQHGAVLKLEEVIFLSFHLAKIHILQIKVSYCVSGCASWRSVLQWSKAVKCWLTSQICAVRGSTVDISCIYRTPSTAKGPSVSVDKILWFTEVQDSGAVDLRTDLEYAGRLRYYCDKMTCTLRITDLRESDSSVYKFTFKYKQHRRHTLTPGVILSVTGNIFIVVYLRTVRSGKENNNKKKRCLFLPHSSRPAGETIVFYLSWAVLSQRLLSAWTFFLHLVQEWTGNSGGNIIFILRLLWSCRQLFLCRQKTRGFSCSSSVWVWHFHLACTHSL